MLKGCHVFVKSWVGAIASDGGDRWEEGVLLRGIYIILNA